MTERLAEYANQNTEVTQGKHRSRNIADILTPTHPLFSDTRMFRDRAPSKSKPVSYTEGSLQKVVSDRKRLYESKGKK